MRPKRHYRNMNPAIADEIRRRYFARQAAQRLLAQAANMLREGGEGGEGEVQTPFTGVDIHLPGGETLRLGHRSTGNGAATPPETHQNGAPRDDQGNGRG